ncbi:MAG: DamX protein [Oleiphilaceae bacterium]
MIHESNKAINLTEQLVTHFDLNGDPFSVESACFFEDAQRKHNVETLRHLAIFGDMVLLLTGEIGAGKTSLIDRFVKIQDSELNIHAYKNPAQFIRNSSGAGKSDSLGAVNYFADLLGLAKVEGESAVQTLCRLIQQSDLAFQDAGKRTLLVIDDADLLSKEELTLFFTVFRSLPVESGVVLLLAGTPKLLRFASEDGDIGRDETLHQIQLKPLTNNESIDYIRCRLASVGYCDALSLSDSQRDNLAKMGKGLPGRINRFFAYIVFELGLPEAEKPSVNHVPRKVLFSIVGLLFLSFILVSYQHGLLNFSMVNSEVVVDQEVEVSKNDSLAKTEESQLIELQRKARLMMLDLAIQESAPTTKVSDSHATEVFSSVEGSEPTESFNDTRGSSGDDANVAESVSAKPKEVLNNELVAVLQTTQKDNKEIQADSEKLKEFTSNMIEKKQVSEINISAEKSNQNTTNGVSVPLADDKIVSTEETANNHKSFRSKDWVISQSSTSYTAQLLGSYSEETAIKFIEQAGVLDLDIYYLKTFYKGRDWYVVFYGSFSSKKSAKNAVSVAPKLVQQQGPWLRRFDGILNSYPK